VRTDQQITQEIRAHGRGEFYRYLAMFLTCAGMAAAAVIISISSANRQAREQRDADRSAMCALVVVQDDAYRTPPGPTTPVGKATARALSDLRRAYQCDKKG